jgi:hypothetical protein
LETFRGLGWKVSELFLDLLEERLGWSWSGVGLWSWLHCWITVPYNVFGDDWNITGLGCFFASLATTAWAEDGLEGL